jgi:hypothetical protein
MYKLVVALIVLIIIGSGAGFGGILIWKNYLNEGTETTTLVSVQEIKKISELATVEYHLSAYEKRRDFGKSDLLKVIPRDYFVLVKGKVIGGVNLEYAVIDIDHEKKHVDIKFKKGAIKIHSPEIAAGDIELKSCKDNIFDPIKEANWQAAVKAAQETLLRTATENGIQKKTANEAQTLITGFLKSLGYTSKVVFS